MGAEGVRAISERNASQGNDGITKNIYPGLKISADPYYFDICLINILENAINYSPEKEKIIISANDAKEFAIIEVNDSGPGFSKNAIDNLFKYFGLGENPVDQDFGLGLAMVKLIMDIHSGAIEVKNNETAGALLKLKFPYA